MTEIQDISGEKFTAAGDAIAKQAKSDCDVDLDDGAASPSATSS
jgi:hypothetical protein